MTTRYIDTNIISTSGTAVTAAASQDIYVLAGVTVGATDGSLAISDSNANGTMEVDGYTFSGIAMFGAGGRLIVGSTGLVASGNGGSGVGLEGEGSLLTNDGRIEGGAAFESDVGTVVNSGIISSQNSALFFNGLNNSLTNSGVLSGSIVNPTVLFEEGQNTINNSGTISGERGAIEAGAGLNTINNSGTMEGSDNDDTIDLRGGQNTIVNSGTVSSGSGNAIAIEGGSNEILNTNTISAGGEAIALSGGGNFVGNWGTIVSPFSPINLDSESASDPLSTIHNFGTIAASTGRDAIYGGSGGGAFIVVNRGEIDGFIDGAFIKAAATVVNSGHIDGGILFAGSADTYDGTHGDITGLVTGGGGNDTLKGGSVEDNLEGDAGNDVLKGGDGDDTLNGGVGADRLNGGTGDNTFVYGAVADSKGTTHDTITGMDAQNDTFDFSFTVSGVSNAVTTGALHEATFTTDLAADLPAGKLGAHHAVVFTASTGDLAGHTYLIVDANGTAGYQAASDYVIELKDAAHLAALSTSNFI